MEMKVIHERFRDDDSPSVEGQIRWLQKQGFAQQHIEQALISIYGDIEHGHLPRVYLKPDGEKQYLPAKVAPDPEWGDGAEIRTGHELDQVLLFGAKQARTDDLTAMIKNVESFWDKQKAKWEFDRQAKEQAAKKGVWQRLTGR